jgi:two-component system chemotaxis response regulator CheB
MSMPEDQISVLIVDDSALMRNLIGSMVESSPGMMVGAKAMNGNFALKKIPAVDPDIIILDLEMPEMNGIEFLKERKKLGWEIPVIILSSIARQGATVTMEAISLGASDFILKPEGPAGIKEVQENLADMIRAYAGQYRSHAGSKKKKLPYIPPTPVSSGTAFTAIPKIESHLEKRQPRRLPDKPEIVAIGISTGGPNALRKVFSEFPTSLGVPIVVVQHMPPGFTAEFAKSLDKICPLEVKEAADGDLLKPDRILIAPGSAHLYVEKKSLAAVARLSDADPVNGHRPSADVLFESVAKHYSNRCVAVIMTGMGKDGARKIGEIYEEGGMTIGQDEGSSIVYGMPRVAYEAGYIRKQSSLDNMARAITEAVKGNQAPQE